MFLRLTAALAAAMLAATAAFADGLNVNIVNGTNQMVLVTVTDVNTSPMEKVFNGQLLPAIGQSVSINPDSSGNGHLLWTATTSDQSMCGNGEENDLSAGTVITVTVNSPCP
jgi:hypothetical protein